VSKVLIHICCAHCAAYTAEYWKQQGHETAGYWYNPNIHPYMEHQNRLEAVKKLAQEKGLELIIEEGFEMPEFLRRAAPHPAERCGDCFTMRLEKTAAKAKEKGYDGFTTTLLISPHQKHELIISTGEKAAVVNGVKFFYTDLRKRFSDSRHITKPMDLYRQQYCGCIYSEWERYKEESPKN
jgi:epoxyqueuosine reductase